MMPPSKRCGRLRQPKRPPRHGAASPFDYPKVAGKRQSFPASTANQGIDASRYGFVPPSHCKVHSTKKTTVFAMLTTSLVQRRDVGDYRIDTAALDIRLAIPLAAHACALLVDRRSRANCAAASRRSAPPNRAISARVCKKPAWN